MLVTRAGFCYGKISALRALAQPRFFASQVQADDQVVKYDEMLNFMKRCIETAGANQSHAAQLAEVLVAGDVRGHYSHGLNRLDMYVRDLQQGVTAGAGVPSILNEKAASGWVNGNNLLGPVVGNFCMDLAVKKAKDVGVGWVVAKGSNHFGIAAHYSMRAMNEGLMGLAFTNTSPVCYPTRAAKPALGTNPLSLAAKGLNNDSFVLDMATTTVAVGKCIKAMTDFHSS